MNVAVPLSNIGLALILSFSAYASPAPNTDAAYSVLIARTMTNQQAFYVYLDADSGLNHGFPSGLFGTISNIQVNTTCIDDIISTNGCSPDFNILDRQRGNVIQVACRPFSAGEFAGVNFEEPQNWGVLQTGRGYDLKGAIQELFSVRSPPPGGISV